MNINLTAYKFLYMCHLGLGVRIVWTHLDGGGGQKFFDPSGGGDF